MASILLFIAIVGVCGLLLWLSYRMEPHWVSKDAERMICYGQGLSRNGHPHGKWREMRVTKIRHDTVEVRPRRGSLTVVKPAGASGVAAGLVKGRRPKASYWKVVGRTETTLRNRVVFMLDGANDADLPDMIALRLPARSKAIPMLDEIAVNRSKDASKPTRGRPQSVARPDPD